MKTEGDLKEVLQELSRDDMTQEQRDALFAIEKIGSNVFPEGFIFAFSQRHPSKPEKGLGIGAMVKADGDKAIKMYEKLGEALFMSFEKAAASMPQPTGHA